MAASAARSRPISAKARSARSRFCSTSATAWAFAPAVTTAYTPKRDQQQDHRCDEPDLHPMHGDPSRQRCWRAGGGRSSLESDRRRADYQHCLVRWVKEAVNDSATLCQRSGQPRFGDGDADAASSIGRKFDEKATWTYMWDTRPKEPRHAARSERRTDVTAPPLDVLANRFLDGYPYLCRATDISRPRHAPATVQRAAAPAAATWACSSSCPARDEILTASGEVVFERRRQPGAWGSASPTCRQRRARPSNAICHLADPAGRRADLTGPAPPAMARGKLLRRIARPRLHASGLPA